MFEEVPKWFCCLFLPGCLAECGFCYECRIIQKLGSMFHTSVMAHATVSYFRNVIIDISNKPILLVPALGQLTFCIWCVHDVFMFAGGR